VLQTAVTVSRPFLASAAAKRYVVGVALLLVILVPFAALNRLPKLDTIREDLGAALAPTAQCFQGFCIEDPDSASERTGFFGRWWRFSVAYLECVAVGMLFAFVAAAIAEAFLVSNVSVRAGLATSDGRPDRWRRILKGIGLGPVLNLCSACIAPVSSTLRRGGMGVEGALALVHGSATLNVPSLLMIAVVFSPLLGASRLTLGLVAALSLGPLGDPSTWHEPRRPRQHRGRMRGPGSGGGVCDVVGGAADGRRGMAALVRATGAAHVAAHDRGRLRERSGHPGAAT
jgi:hypothetical protein